MTIESIELQMSPEAVIQSGLKRLMQLTAKFGIESPQVLSGVERWGMILDDVTHPPQYCENCGANIHWSYDTDTWYHTDRTNKSSERTCVTKAGAFAKPRS